MTEADFLVIYIQSYVNCLFISCCLFLYKAVCFFLLIHRTILYVTNIHFFSCYTLCIFFLNLLLTQKFDIFYIQDFVAKSTYFLHDSWLVSLETPFIIQDQK